ncbi:MBL fold metallo-hydrolase [Edaphobacter flagellatus]|uniref:MBL fold metallo-hydrolase n=1 Tax=Edaphobacter flagellatus TaxID=1933044 RepID=UPI0021B3527F|nr:MBL fold metallo-hydrolase [Edaphobacter flagellatus]
MKIERFQVPGLAQYSYVVSDGGQAVVIDPIRDTDRYLDYAARMELRIVSIVETHIHADFAAGSTALAQSTGAELALSAYDQNERYRYTMPHRTLHDGDSIVVGSLHLQVLHTPGHTPEHLSFLLFNGASSVHAAMFSGDFIFVGSLGRPDLLGEEAKLSLAHELYRSLHQRIAALPDGLLVYPGHGAGSLCGAGISERTETTLGYERATNPFFRYGEEEFVTKILASVPPMPAYYPRMKELNSIGAPVLSALPGVAAFSAEQVDVLLGSIAGVTLLDLRSPEAFGGAHVRGSINIAAGDNLSLWAGWLLDPKLPIVLIGSEGDEYEARRSLIRVGLDNIAGYLDRGISAWILSGRDFATTTQKTVNEVAALSQANISGDDATLILDVRSDQERSGSSIPGSHHIMLGDLAHLFGRLPRDREIITVCGSGYRSSIAASLLARAGFECVASMSGGMMAWAKRSAK